MRDDSLYGIEHRKSHSISLLAGIYKRENEVPVVLVICRLHYYLQKRTFTTYNTHVLVVS